MLTKINEVDYRKTSNKRPWRLLEYGTRNPGI